MAGRIVKLGEAPEGVTLRLVDIIGGHGVRRRLLALGFHKGDLIKRNSHALFGGPVLVKNLTCDASVALGRGIAQKIIVEIVDGET